MAIELTAGVPCLERCLRLIIRHQRVAHRAHHLHVRAWCVMCGVWCTLRGASCVVWDVRCVLPSTSERTFSQVTTSSSPFSSVCAFFFNIALAKLPRSLALYHDRLSTLALRVCPYGCRHSRNSSRTGPPTDTDARVHAPPYRWVELRKLREILASFSAMHK